MQNKPKVKDAKMNVNIYNTMDYENKHNWTLGQNKPNQTQFKANSNPISKIPKMNVNIYYITAYNNKTLLPRIQNKPNSNPNKPNFYPLV